MAEFMGFVKEYGFPIAVCVYLLFQQAKQDDYYRTLISEMRKSIDALTDAVDDLTDYIKGGN